VESEIPPLTKQTNRRKKNNKLYTWIIKRVWDVCIRYLSTTTIHITVVMGEPWYTWLKSLKQRKIKTLLICEMKTTSRLVQHRQKYKMRIVGWILNYLPSKLKNICIFEIITQKHVGYWLLIPCQECSGKTFLVQSRQKFVWKNGKIPWSLSSHKKNRSRRIFHPLILDTIRVWSVKYEHFYKKV